MRALHDVDFLSGQGENCRKAQLIQSLTLSVPAFWDHF